MAPKASAGPTPAIEQLRRAGVSFRLHEYEAVTPSPGREPRAGYGEAAAAALGVDPARLFKTLVVEVDGRLVAAVVPVTTELDPKRLAAAVGGRRAVLAEAVVAERVSGSVVGGISPLAMRRRLAVVADRTIEDHPTIFVSAGRRGLQAELAPGDLIRACGATVAPIRRA